MSDGLIDQLTDLRVLIIVSKHLASGCDLYQLSRFYAVAAAITPPCLFWLLLNQDIAVSVVTHALGVSIMEAVEELNWLLYLMKLFNLVIYKSHQHQLTELTQAVT